MKIMYLHRPLNNFFKAIFLLLIFSANLFAADFDWEVAVVFRGGNEDLAFQNDIDKNILELARTIPGSSFKLGIYRELSDFSTYSFIPSIEKGSEIPLGRILYRQDLNTIYTKGIFKTGNNLNIFLKSFYTNQKSKKALIIYSHGLGANGLKGLSTKKLKETLTQSAPHLDLLWFGCLLYGQY